jgi:hypothetical protein
MMRFKDYVKMKEAEESSASFKRWRNDIQESRKKGGDARVWIERRTDALGFMPAKIVLELLKPDGDVATRETDEWDSDLNQALTIMGVRSGDTENESVRLCLALTGAFDKVEIRYGDGYFSAVFVDLIKNIDFTDYPDVGKMLKYSTALGADQNSASYHDCKAMIEAIIHKQIDDLRTKLKYDDNEISDILAQAIVQYLDQRFSVSNRRKLGLLNSQ